MINVHPRALVTDGLDLVLARACLRCEVPGRVLCDACLARLRGRVRTTSSFGLPVHAALAYDAGGGDLVIAYKDHGNRALAPMLGTLLADAIDAAMRELSVPAAQLVPVPARPWSERGFNAVAGIVRFAQRDLLARGIVVRTARPIRAQRRRSPMKSLSGQERRQQVGQLFRPARLRRPAADLPVVIVDDVITTGTTVEAMRSVLTAMGADVAAAAAVTSVDRPAQPG